MGIFFVGNELSKEEDWDTWKDDTKTGEEPVLKKNSLDAATAAAAEDDVVGFPAQPPSVHESSSKIVKRGILSSPTPLPPHPPRDLLQQESTTSPCVGDVLLVGFSRKRVQRKSPKQTPSSVLFRFLFFCFFGKTTFFLAKEGIF